MVLMALVISIHQSHQDHREETFVIIEQGTEIGRASDSNVFAIKGTTGMGNIPPPQELVSNGTPFIRCGGTAR